MDEVSREEFVALRATIRERGTARVWLLVAAIALWATLTVVVTAVIPLPVVSLLPLMVLVAAFEAIYGLHVGVERVGRYLQVFYEEGGNSSLAPRWETTAMAYGRSFPGDGPDPLFVAVFGAATLLNLIPVLLPEATTQEIAGLGAAHGLFLIRLFVARRRAAGQRARDLERFRKLAGRE